MQKILTLLIIVAVVAAVMWRNTSDPVSQHSYGEAQIGGSFALTDTHNNKVTDVDLQGRYTLLYLGYTHCPDICPTTLSMLSDVLKKMGTEADKMSVVFISLDPAHDSPAVLAEYLKAFDARIIGLTGSEQEIKAVTMAYKAYANPTPNAAPGNMLIAHSGLLYLMDKQGKYIRHFETGVPADAVVSALKTAMQ